MSGSTSIYMRFSHTIKSGNVNNRGRELDTGDTAAMLLDDFNGNGLSDLVVGDDPPDIVRESYLLNFTNKEIDYTLDLHYFGARYYQSTFPRFISPDPVGGYPMLPITWNRYLYCRNDPVNYLDPDGLEVVVSDALALERIRSSVQAKLRNTITLTNSNRICENTLRRARTSNQNFNDLGSLNFVRKHQ